MAEDPGGILYVFWAVGIIVVAVLIALGLLWRRRRRTVVSKQAEKRAVRDAYRGDGGS